MKKKENWTAPLNYLTQDRNDEFDDALSHSSIACDRLVSALLLTSGPTKPLMLIFFRYELSM
jgi:hypothetical protein